MKATTTTVTKTNTTSATRTMVSVGMLGAISVVLMLVEFPLPFIAPGFYKLDFSEVPILVGAFALGPVAGVMTELIKILLNLVINGTDTAFVGEFANFVMGCAFVIPAALIYKKKKSRKHAIVGLVAGTLIMSLSMHWYCFLLMQRHSECPLMPSCRWERLSIRRSTESGLLYFWQLHRLI